ncbi:LTA synthase family protein [Paenibacillus anaericanus]|uniref:LTA synthase family protein n=1 Tax=Paenibacillus anaericanus TaxID=170367 RepID=UPI0027D7FBEA|nr:LTA synthase family protein [Paenibacillus anaericanus]
MLRYLIFLFAIFYKLKFLHGNLHARYIDMTRLDDLIALGSIMLLSFWTFWLPKRARSIALCVLNVLLTALIFSDLVYYRYFGDFITVPVLLQAGQVGELGESIQSLIHLSDLWLVADWVIWFILVFAIILYRHHYKKGTRSTFPSSFSNHMSSHKKLRPHLRRFATGIIVFILGFIMTMGPIKSYANTWASELFEGNWWNLSLYNATGLLGFHYYDIYQYSKEHLGNKPVLSAQESTEIQQWFDAASASRNVKNDTFGAYADSNVMVVQVEAFMNFMIGQKINGQEITPNFNKLMKESMYFSNFYHQTGQGRTSDADFSAQSSLHPLQTGSVFVRYPDHTFDVMPQILKSHGYETGAFHAYEGSFWNRYNMYNAMGYDHFYTKKNYVMDESLGWSLGDKSFFRQSLEFMNKASKPTYSFLITLTSHHPYSLPASVQSLDVGEFEGSIFGNYLESIHYMDEALGELVDGMKKDGLWDNTILYLYGDHDNSLPEQEDYEKFLGKSLSDLDMQQIMNQVPLLIHLPDGQQAGIYDEPSGQLDMAPSLLHLLGISTEKHYMMGNNLFDGDLNDNFVVLRSGAFTDVNQYYVPSPDNLFENGTCYDLGTRETVAAQQCRIGYQEAKKRLALSDKVISDDLIAELRTKQ